MIHMFIGMGIIMFLVKISTFMGILMQIMLVFGVFGNLRCENILGKTYSISQETDYLAPFILHISNSAYCQFILETITSSSPSSSHFFHIIEHICMTALQYLSVGEVILIGSIENRFKCMANHTYHWIQYDGPHLFSRHFKASHYREKKFK